jgi:hypothetical protein
MLAACCMNLVVLTRLRCTMGLRGEKRLSNREGVQDDSGSPELVTALRAVLALVPS